MGYVHLPKYRKYFVVLSVFQAFKNCSITKSQGNCCDVLEIYICIYFAVSSGVEDTRLEAKAKAKDTKKIRGQGQGQPFQGQTLSRPRTGMLEAKAKDQGHNRKCSPKSQNFFRRSPKKKKKGLHKNF